MELLAAGKEKKLLEAGLEILHRESINWGNSISFWRDETKFYKDLLENKLLQHVTHRDKKRIDALINNIIGKKLLDLKKEIAAHEKNLVGVLKKKSDPASYREKHTLLGTQFVDFSKRMRHLKFAVFELLRLVNMNFFNGNETLEIINERRSVRKYKNTPIDKIRIEHIISAGRMAPSAKNTQPWMFYVLTNKEKIKNYSGEISKVAENILHWSLQKLHKEEDPIFHGAPAVIFITAEKGNDWADLDIGMCAQNMMLAARSMGYDTCPIGLAKAIKQTPVYTELGIPESQEIKLALTLGFGAEKPKPHSRITDNIWYLN